MQIECQLRKIEHKSLIIASCVNRKKSIGHPNVSLQMPIENMKKTDWLTHCCILYTVYIAVYCILHSHCCIHKQYLNVSVVQLDNWEHCDYSLCITGTQCHSVTVV